MNDFICKNCGNVTANDYMIMDVMHVKNGLLCGYSNPIVMCVDCYDKLAAFSQEMAKNNSDSNEEENE